MTYHSQTDLLEENELLPEAIQEVLEAFETEDNTYKACKSLEEALSRHGYSIEWGLDAQPFNLRKIV